MSFPEVLICSDLHLPKRGETGRGIDVWANVEKLLAGMKNYAGRCDTLMVLGDLCLDVGDREVYREIKSELEAFGLDIKCVSGNHDDSAMLAEEFNMKDRLHDTNEVYWSEDRDERGVWLFMDSAVGEVSQQQLDWLRSQVAAHRDRKLLMFIHHPPVLASVPHMDNNYSLKNGREVMRILNSHNLPVNIFCGHYHVQKTVQASGHSVFICPSPFFTIDDTKDEFDTLDVPLAFMRLNFTGGRLEVSRHNLI